MCPDDSPADSISNLDASLAFASQTDPFEVVAFPGPPRPLVSRLLAPGQHVDLVAVSPAASGRGQRRDRVQQGVARRGRHDEASRGMEVNVRI